MFRKVSGERPDRVSFLLVPNFSMSAFTAMLEALRLANYATGRTLYEWEILSRDGDAVEASNGVHVVADKGIADEPHPDNVVVCSGVGAQLYQDNAVFGWLRRWAREGAHVGALCTGAHVLAHAGLLKGYRCTIHWENLESFREQHPELDVQAELFEIDRDRFTCAGGIAAADMMLTEIARRHGDEVASAVSGPEPRGDRRPRRPVPPPARAPVPPLSEYQPGALLSAAPAGARAAAADADDDAGHRDRLCLRVHLRLALLQVLPRHVRADPPRSAANGKQWRR
jgi:transcriptional regulator GlxA family with amidase domain